MITLFDATIIFVSGTSVGVAVCDLLPPARAPRWLCITNLAFATISVALVVTVRLATSVVS